MSQQLLSTLKQLVSGMDEGLVIFDQAGKILHASYDLHQMVDETITSESSIFDFVVDHDNTLRTDIRNIKTSKYIDVRVLLLRKGEPFPARLRLAAWRTNENEFIVMGSVIDATILERKRRISIRKTLTIEYLSRSTKIREGRLNDAINEMLQLSCRAVRSTRVNAWFFNRDGSLLEPVGNYDSRVNDFFEPETLVVMDTPKYFELFKTNRVIVATNAQNLAEVSELKDSYLIPNRIVSLMDIPIRSEGKIIGVLCFEQVKEPRHWSLEDQKFGLIIAQLISLAYETHNRKKLQQELEMFMHKQKSMCHEMNHRIVGNLELTKRLIELQTHEAKDEYHKNLLKESVSRIDSVAALHDLLMDENQEVRVSISKYLEKIGNSLRNFTLSDHSNIQLIVSSDSLKLSSTLAMCMGVIINEAVVNAVNHGFKENELGIIRVDFKMNKNQGKLHVFDNGVGYENIKTIASKGVKIMREMASHMNGEIDFDGRNGSNITVSFPLA